MKDILVQSSTTHGKGLFAGRNFTSEEIILSWENERILDKLELAALPESEKEFVSTLEDGRYILFGEPARFMNHSCNPNTIAKNNANIAARDIKKGEELTTDYQLEGAINTFDCNCGSTNCRNNVGNEIVTFFEQIRDIPYSIPLTDNEKNNSCSGKVILLKKHFEDNGYSARYRVCDFQWSDLNLPEEVTSLPHNNNSTHVYLEVEINGEWIDIDPTWDKQLEEILPISYWDGISSTSIAVTPTNLYSHEESQQIMEEPDIEGETEDIEKNIEFYKGLNNYFETIRNK